MSTGKNGGGLQAHGYVRAIAPYQGGKPIEELARELGLQPEAIVKLASNENPLGMPASAKAAITRATELGRYPDGNGFELKKALSAKLGVPMDWLTLGNGSNDILELASATMLAPGTSAVYAQHSFAVYALATQSRGARAIVVPAREYGHDLDAMAAAIAPDTRVVFIANPNNPTGTFLTHERVAAFIAKVPAGVLVVLDEAYNEYLPPELRFETTAWVKKYPNLLISRTFSKIFGLAGLRIGYGIAQAELTDMLNRVRQPFNVNALAQVAAIAALNDTAFQQQSYEVNQRGMKQLVDGFRALGLQTVPSYGNFVLVKVGSAGKVYQALLEQGVIVRPVANYGLPEFLRVTIGLPEENAKLLDVLPAALAAARA